MFVLLEGTDRDLLEHLNHLLHWHGVQTVLSEAGCTDEGQPRFVLEVVLYLDMARARTLLYRSPLLLNDVQPQHRQAFLELRRAPGWLLLDWLASPLALRLSGMCLLLLLLGLLTEYLIS